jgi:hypothetical protein
MGSWEFEIENLRKKTYVCSDTSSVEQINAKSSHFLSGVATHDLMKHKEACFNLDGSISIVTVGPVGCDCEV